MDLPSAVFLAGGENYRSLIHALAPDHIDSSKGASGHAKTQISTSSLASI
jgi:hypothetical protein